MDINTCEKVADDIISRVGNEKLASIIIKYSKSYVDYNKDITFTVYNHFMLGLVLIINNLSKIYPEKYLVDVTQENVDTIMDAIDSRPAGVLVQVYVKIHEFMVLMSEEISI